MTNYIVKYQINLHTYNKTEEEKISVERGLRYFNEIDAMNYTVNSEPDAVAYVKNLYKTEGAEKLFTVPQEVYDNAEGIGATSLTILRCWVE
jgi:hypothetical protein